MISSSAGCISTAICPFSIRKPPITAANTTRIPTIANMKPPRRQRHPIASRMHAGLHRLLRPLQQLGQLIPALGFRRAHAHRQRHPVAPPAEIRRPRKPHQHLRMIRQHLAAPLLGEDQELVVAPSPDFLARPQRVGQRPLHAFQHRLARPRAVRLASVPLPGPPSPTALPAARLRAQTARRQPPAGPASPPGSPAPPNPRWCRHGAAPSCARPDETPPPSQSAHPDRRAGSPCG